MENLKRIGKINGYYWRVFKSIEKDNKCCKIVPSMYLDPLLLSIFAESQI